MDHGTENKKNTLLSPTMSRHISPNPALLLVQIQPTDHSAIHSNGQPKPNLIHSRASSHGHERHTGLAASPRLAPLPLPDLTLLRPETNPSADPDADADPEPDADPLKWW
jgi:hypothetical protein